MIHLLLSLTSYRQIPTVTQPPLILAIRRHDIATARKLLEQGADPNAKELHLTKPSLTEGTKGGEIAEGLTALDLAAEASSTALVRLLLEFKADPNRKGIAGTTPLMIASQKADPQLVKLLLSHGAKPDLRNQYGDTALVDAANIDRVENARLLIQAGANPNGGTGTTPLSLACACSSLKVLALLLKEGANPNYHRPGKQAPLEYAVEYSSKEIVSMLRHAGAKGRNKPILDKERAAQYAKENSKRKAEVLARTKANASFVHLMPEDNDVIGAVINDIAATKPAEFGFEKAEFRLVDSTSSISNPEYFEGQLNVDLNDGEACEIGLDMRRDLLRRNAGAVSLKSLVFNPIVHLSPDEYGRQDGLPWLHISLPGYSADRTRAIVHFTHGPGLHMHVSNYLLTKKNGSWRVVWRHFTEYV